MEVNGIYSGGWGKDEGDLWHSPEPLRGRMGVRTGEGNGTQQGGGRAWIKGKPWAPTWAAICDVQPSSK